MARPKSILWVDDEVESLTSHILFLEEQGFAVETSAHGDDALALLQRQPYGVVLLDEQMPGRRGLELFRAIRAMDHGMPVVMVTKSEESETLKDAIGAEISDYLIKPVNPRQILSVVTRLLDGDRIRQQRLSRDSPPGSASWKRGGAAAGLARMGGAGRRAGGVGMRLGQAGDPGLQGALRTLQESLRQDFARYLSAPLRPVAARSRQRPAAALGGHRGRVSEAGAGRAPPGAAGDGGLPAAGPVGDDPAAHLRPLRHRDRALLLDPAHRDPLRPERDLQRPLSRRDQGRYPKWWSDQEEASLNPHEAELLTEQLKELTGRSVPVHYEKVFTAPTGRGCSAGPAHLAQEGVTALVFNFLDMLTHGRTENSTLYEVARDTSALRNLTRTWFERSPLWDALREAERRRVPVLLTTDHGSIHCHSPATVFAKRDTTANLRYKFGDDLRAQDPDAALVVDDLASFGLPARAPGTRLLLATGDRFFVYPTKLREYQARYRGAFLHGGVSPEEVILPIALLTRVKPSSREARKVVSSPSGEEPAVGADQPEEPQLGPHRHPCRGVRSAIGRITSSGDTPPCRNAPR